MNIDPPLPSQIPALRNLWQEAFGDSPEFLHLFFTTAFSASRSRCVILDGKLVAALYWFDCLHQNRRIAYLYAIATAKACRGQGICHALMTDTHRHLTKLGYAGSILVPGSRELFQLYEGMGYQTCSYMERFCCSSAEEGISLSPIDQVEYARLRREFLPHGGVVQEGENLDFFDNQATFYTGTEFLLAAYQTNDMLYGVELLGNKALAPQITHTLGYSEATFRTPGNDVPFSMYYPLAEPNLPFPSYFGLAFD